MLIKTAYRGGAEEGNVQIENRNAVDRRYNVLWLCFAMATAILCREFELLLYQEVHHAD